MAGYPCDVKKIASFCNSKKIKLIEDCAIQLVLIKAKHLKNYGIAGCFLFIQLNKLQLVKEEW